MDSMGMECNMELDSTANSELALHLEDKNCFLGIKHSKGVLTTAWH